MLRLFSALFFASIASASFAQAIEQLEPTINGALIVRNGEVSELTRCDNGGLCLASSKRSALNDALGKVNRQDTLPEQRAAFAGRGDIAAAWYARPTDRYKHGVLGDRIEGGSLKVNTDGETYEYVLPTNRVFEDIVPRLADLDGDKRTEIITIQSSVNAGAAVVIYGMRNGKITELAKSDFIGTPNRWLNIAGIANYRNARQGKQIVWVETPHIGGKIHIGTFDGEKFTVEGPEQFKWPRGKAVMSNHAIGSRDQSLSVTVDIDENDTLELIVPGADRKGMWIMRDGIEITKIGSFPRSFTSNVAFIGFKGASGGSLVTIDKDGNLMKLDVVK